MDHCIGFNPETFNTEYVVDKQHFPSTYHVICYIMTECLYTYEEALQYVQLLQQDLARKAKDPFSNHVITYTEPTTLQLKKVSCDKQNE